MADITEAAKTDDNRQAGGKFGPGNCANPGGRPKMSKEEREAWQALATKCRVKMDKLIESGELPPATLAKFAEVALDRAYGKAIQAVELGDPDGNSFMLSIEDRRNRFNELLEKAKNDGK
jgi:hypothetical protein